VNLENVVGVFYLGAVATITWLVLSALGVHP
jgi:hypothetical protein